MFGSYIYHIDDLIVEISGKDKVEFDCSGTSDSDFAVKYKEKEFDLKRFKDFFQALILSTTDEYCYDEEPTGKLYAKVSIVKNNELDDEIIEFYETDTRKLLIRKNGVTIAKCSKAFIDNALAPNLDLIEAEDEFITNW